MEKRKEKTTRETLLSSKTNVYAIIHALSVGVFRKPRSNTSGEMEDKRKESKKERKRCVSERGRKRERFKQ